MISDQVRYERFEEISIVTLNRPQRRNALSLAMMRELISLLDAIGQSPACRVVILAAEGTVFCAGHDLAELTNRSLNDYREIFGVCTELMERLERLPQPVIAEVQGMATAAGCQLAAACDLAVASESAAFATPGVSIGLFCTTPMIPLTRAIGRKRALEMLLTGDPIDAATALEWGLVNRICPASQLREASLEVAYRIAAASPLTVSLGKSAFYEQIDLDTSRAYAYGKEVMALNALADDAQEGITAFLEKRIPEWTGQ
jgi:enoyl-CoA hydratase/carnithine racemase